MSTVTRRTVTRSRCRVGASHRLVDRPTDREVEVLYAYLVTGSVDAAAYQLGISLETVKHHLANARSKVDAANTAQLVWVLSSRLPEPDDMAQKRE